MSRSYRSPIVNTDHHHNSSSHHSSCTTRPNREFTPSMHCVVPNKDKKSFWKDCEEIEAEWADDTAITPDADALHHNDPNWPVPSQWKEEWRQQQYQNQWKAKNAHPQKDYY
eukprot:NODE_1711_length_423_cov_14.233108_g1701_i0.p2 GENE.NODE_1711_length_423_cov_14.233108_g1701_i0~~NODE_1711_length_423_cov_14.233108_g1701_i0.p2  ORF type:complete len:121 (+),score=31.65 NODE_1711_length_423_cov_14.233108_g1701_i0:29-364(+)